ncbi:MAG TPA: WD40 repeat domain-containing protein [Caulobacteraceae bacterium]|nr:WD40 repeat domain-containing protein [Caulobacteraceae bacterium]
MTAALFEASGEAVFALGDGQVRWESGAGADAHAGAILCAARHPKAPGVISGGDDGRLVWSGGDGGQSLAETSPSRWIESLAVVPGQSLVAFGAGREARILDLADPGFARTLVHDHSVADLAFEPRGRRLAVASYGGAALWYARIEVQKPAMLRWAGSHIGLAFSPDGRFLISSTQENALHGWRLADARDMRMGGYPAKVRSLAFLAGGRWLATSGARGVVVWPFAGADGPMGKEAMEIGFEADSLVARVAAEPAGGLIVAGLVDGRIWAGDVGGGATRSVKAETGPAITALALGGGRIAWGDEEGGAGVEPVPAP